MSFRGFRRALGAEPRWLMAVLLAFAIETLPAASTVVAHRHAGGESGHSHAGLLHAVSDAVPSRPVGDGLTRAPARDLHRHAVHPVLAVRTPDVAAPAPTILAVALFLAATADELVVPWGLAQARAPPSLAA